MISKCQQCSQLPPPPPIFSLGPPPNILSLDIHCSSRLLLSSLVQHKKVTSSSSVPITLSIIITLVISTCAILFIKNRLIKRQRQRKYDHNSLSVKYNGHNDHQNRTKFIPLLSDSCSSDQTISTPINEYPLCGINEPFLSNDIHHEYEQINYDDNNNSSNYYYLIYCRQCENYHQTSRLYCTCHIQNDDKHLFELQPISKN